MPGRHFLIRLPAAISTPARGMGVGFQRVPFGGFAFISPVFRIHVHVLVLNYIKCITCTVKSPHLRHVYYLNYNEYIEDIPL